MPTTPNEKEDETPFKVNLGELLGLEKRLIKERRKKKQENENVIEDSFAIALSGGGIRAATICLGIMEQFNKKGLIQKADYLSSVSGGGYIASYIHNHLHTEKDNANKYDKLFSDGKNEHLRNHREHLYRWPNYKWCSRGAIAVEWFFKLILSWAWFVLPLLAFYFFGLFSIIMIGSLLIALALTFLISPNFTSLHSYYRNRLSETYLNANQKTKILDLTSIDAPYPLINATVHVDKDDYHEPGTVSYRGKINASYFLFSPTYCGSQVTHYSKTKESLYTSCTLATAMATSGAAFSTFMANANNSSLIRWLVILFNFRIGILSPNPMLKKNKLPIFWPYYTMLEFFGKAKTSTNQIQISDGGHIENLGIYELLRRKVKTIIAIDSGQDENFDFADLRNLIIRARNELGAIIEFDDAVHPATLIKPDIVSGASKSHFSIATIKGIKGSYADGYNGMLIYIKSSVLPNKEYKIRSLKKRVLKLEKEKSEAKDEAELKEKEAALELKMRKLDRVMYRTYTPDFPHQTTIDQFYTKEQWDAYYHLGKSIGENVIESLDLKKEDERIDIYHKSLACLNALKATEQKSFD